MSKKMFNTSNNALHVALLILRIGFGVIFVLHGWPKITGGVDTWSGIGGAMGVVGLDFAPAFWGFLAALAEFGGGLLLIFGFLTRPAAALMLITMLVAVLMHSAQGDALTTILHPLKGLVVFIALLYSGAGKYSIDSRFAAGKG
ncbi:MAG: DoxX family protein [Bacteroidota bacterium]